MSGSTRPHNPIPVFIGNTNLGFGWLGFPTDHALELRNFGELPFDAISLDPDTTGLTLLSPALPFTVAPGQSVGMTFRHSRNELGPFSGWVTLGTVPAVDPEAAFFAQGTTAASSATVTITPTAVDFGDLALGTHADAVVSIQAFGPIIPVHFESVTFEPGTGAFSFTQPPPPNTGFGPPVQLHLRFEPLALGTIEDTLVLERSDGAPLAGVVWMRVTQGGLTITARGVRLP